MNRRIAPTIIVVILVFFILLQAGTLVYAFTKEGLGILWKVLIVVIPLIIIAALISVYLERLREIKEEEKDDLSKY